MVEASPVKVFLARYFFLGLALIQWLVTIALLIRFPATNKNIFAALLFLTLGSLFYVLYLMFGSRIKRVAISKKKIVVIGKRRNVRFDWPDVKSLTIVPYFNLYRLKVKKKKRPIYFFPSKNIDPPYGFITADVSRTGEIVKKKKKKHKIR